ncbi:MAG: hypothetical protein QOG72_2420 [Sphingomonadales bacterium]|jgi:hypothetical protein|nr:hypothetical protein [Sphingomonadales bacterium]
MTETRTAAQKLHSAQIVKVRLEGTSLWIRVDKCEIHAVRAALGGWDRIEVDMVPGGGKAIVLVSIRMAA